MLRNKKDALQNTDQCSQQAGTKSTEALSPKWVILSLRKWPFSITGIHRQPDRKPEELANGVPAFLQTVEVEKEEGVEVADF